MKLPYQIILSVMLLTSGHIAHSKNIITFFLRPYPTAKPADPQKLNAMLHYPGTLARKAFKALLQTGTWQGVLATYMGYIAPSAYDGQILFPRMHQKPSVKLLITQMIEPVMMLGATVHHFVTLKTIPSKLYTITRKQDSDTGIFYWDTQEEQLPENRKISLDTIVLFAKPKNIKVPTGVTETTDSPMLVLPDVYATKTLNSTVSALRVLKIRNFFAPVTFAYKKQSDTEYAKQLK